MPSRTNNGPSSGRDSSMNDGSSGQGSVNICPLFNYVYPIIATGITSGSLER